MGQVPHGKWKGNFYVVKVILLFQRQMSEVGLSGVFIMFTSFAFLVVFPFSFMSFFTNADLVFDSFFCSYFKFNVYSLRMISLMHLNYLFLKVKHVLTKLFLLSAVI